MSYWILYDAVLLGMTGKNLTGEIFLCNRYALLKPTNFPNLITKDVRQLCGSDLIVVSSNFGQPQHILEFRGRAHEAFSDVLAVRTVTAEASPQDIPVS